MHIKSLITSVLAIMPLGVAQRAESQETPPQNTVFPKAVEEALALRGAPEHLRAAATVYVYGPKGYEKSREGTNGFTCLVNRDAFLYASANFKPTCWDAVGKDTYLPVMLRVGALLATGGDAVSVRREITAGFALGEFRAPATGGVAYMLAGDVELDRQTGQIKKQAFPGHYMFYAVGVTTLQLGTTREASQSDPTLPSVFSGGAGGEHGLSYIIAVPCDADRQPRLPLSTFCRAGRSAPRSPSPRVWP